MSDETKHYTLLSKRDTAGKCHAICPFCARHHESIYTDVNILFCHCGKTLLITRECRNQPADECRGLMHRPHVKE